MEKVREAATEITKKKQDSEITPPKGKKPQNYQPKYLIWYCI
jgi:hypothetical protein